MKNAIEIKDLVKRYDNKFELGKIDLKIQSGTIVGLIGENGAGKTTLMRVLTTVLSPTSGTVTLDGILYSGRNFEKIQGNG